VLSSKLGIVLPGQAHEGLKKLSTLYAIEVKAEDNGACLKIPVFGKEKLLQYDSNWPGLTA
jgi:hypothetical protein